MSDSSIDKAVFAFLASCVGDFAQWPQCSIVALQGHNDGGRPSRVFFKVMAVNSDDRTVFRIIVTKDGDWRVRVIQLSNHVLVDESGAERGTIVNAVNRFAELVGMKEAEES
jgi:hypothetical protein|nr:MAG TPA: hypothetical protein [Caudoviricetes sp.]